MLIAILVLLATNLIAQCWLLVRLRRFEQYQTDREQAVSVPELAGTQSDVQCDIDSAFERYQQAEDEGDVKAADAYLINAVSRSDRRLPYLQVLTDRALSSNDRHGIERALAVLETALYQAVTEEIPGILELCSRTEAPLQVNEPDESPAPFVADWQKQFEQLKAEGPCGDAIWDEGAIDDYLAGLQQLDEALADMGGDADKDVASDVAHELERWSSIAAVRQRALVIESECGRIEESAKSDIDAAVWMLQATEPAFASLRHGVDHDLPEPIAQRIGELQDRIDSAARDIALHRSEPLVERIRELSLEPDNGEIKLQQKYTSLEKRIEQAQIALAGVVHPDKREEGSRILKEMVEDLRASRRQQFMKYQEWALNVCDGFGKGWKDKKVYVSEKQAIALFEKETDFFRIDASLLTPEVRMVFDRLMGKLMDKLPPINQVQCGRKTLVSKRGLENF